jgi:hypothetical protein
LSAARTGATNIKVTAAAIATALSVQKSLLGCINIALLGFDR